MKVRDLFIGFMLSLLTIFLMPGCGVQPALTTEATLQGKASLTPTAAEPTETPAPPPFCDNSAVYDLVRTFDKAVRSLDGSLLAQIVHPQNGLTIRFSPTSPEVKYSAEEIAGIFTDTSVKDWGIHSGSGLPIQGTFENEILKWLDDVLNRGYRTECNTLEFNIATGGTSGVTDWPAEYSKIAFIALYRPGPEGMEMDWRTWALGIEYYDGKPYLSILVQYNWEI